MFDMIEKEQLHDSGRLPHQVMWQSLDTDVFIENIYKVDIINEISLTKSSYASGEIYVLKNSATPKAVTGKPIT